MESKIYEYRRLLVTLICNKKYFSSLPTLQALANATKLKNSKNRKDYDSLLLAITDAIEHDYTATRNASLFLKKAKLISNLKYVNLPITEEEFKGLNPFDAILKGDLQLLKEWYDLKNPHPSLDIEDHRYKQTPLLYTAASKGYVNIVNWLIEHKANLNSRQGESGSTALHGAAWNGHLQICEILLFAGTHADTKNYHDEMALDNAEMQGYTEIAKLLTHYSSIQKAYPANSQVILQQGPYVAFRRVELQIKTKDQCDKDIPVGGDRIQAIVVHDTSEKQFPCTIIDNFDGTYIVKFTPTRYGRISITLGVNDEKIPLYSPFCAQIIPETALECTVVGAKGGIIVPGKDILTSFQVKIQDNSQNITQIEDKDIEVTLIDPKNSQCEISLKKVNDNLFNVSYKPSITGEYTIRKITIFDTSSANFQPISFLWKELSPIQYFIEGSPNGTVRIPIHFIIKTTAFSCDDPRELSLIVDEVPLSEGNLFEGSISSPTPNEFVVSVFPKMAGTFQLGVSFNGIKIISGITSLISKATPVVKPAKTKKKKEVVLVTEVAHATDLVTEVDHATDLALVTDLFAGDDDSDFASWVTSAAESATFIEDLTIIKDSFQEPEGVKEFLNSCKENHDNLVAGDVQGMDEESIIVDTIPDDLINNMVDLEAPETIEDELLRLKSKYQYAAIALQLCPTKRLLLEKKWGDLNPGQKVTKEISDYLLAIWMYTDEGCHIYDTLNPALWGMKQSEECNLDTMKNWKVITFHLFKGITELPGVSEGTTLYRKIGAKFVPPSQYVQGNVVVWMGMSSTAIDEESYDVRPPCVLFIIKVTENNFGAKVQDYSEFIEENEVLLPPFCAFKVIEVQNNQRRKDFTYERVIHLECLGITTKIRAEVTRRKEKNINNLENLLKILQATDYDDIGSDKLKSHMVRTTGFIKKSLQMQKEVLLEMKDAEDKQIKIENIVLDK